MSDKIEHAPSSEQREAEPKYALAITETTDNEGTQRTYVPILAEKAHDFYEQYQCDFGKTEGTLAEVLVEAEERVQKDREEGYYISSSLEMPQGRAERRPVDSRYVLPEEE